MEIGSLLEETVVHKSFGTGIIRSADEKYLEIDFPEKNKTKSRFAYPLCFNGFLRLENGEKQAEMQKLLDQWKIESGAGQKEELWHQYEKTMQEIKERQAAAEEKKLRAAQRAMEHRFAYNSMRQEKESKTGYTA